ncbi:hypothetical protein D3C83_165560 [compost metagenome]
MCLGRIEGQQLLHQGEGHAFGGGNVQAGQLQPDVLFLPLPLEYFVFLLEVEQGTGGNGYDKLAFE